MDTATLSAAPTTPRPRKAGLAVIPPEAVRRYAPKIFGLVQTACDYSGGRYTPEVVIAACSNELPFKAQLWVFGYSGGGQPPTAEAIAVTCISTFATGLKVLEVLMCAGQGSKAWLQFEPTLAAWAEAEGCERMQIIGRRGWAKTLPNNWRESARMFERLITPQAGVEGDPDAGQ